MKDEQDRDYFVRLVRIEVYREYVKFMGLNGKKKTRPWYKLPAKTKKAWGDAVLDMLDFVINDLSSNVLCRDPDSKQFFEFASKVASLGYASYALSMQAKKVTAWVDLASWKKLAWLSIGGSIALSVEENSDLELFPNLNEVCYGKNVNGKSQGT